MSKTKKVDVDSNQYSFNRLIMTGLPNNIDDKEVKKIIESYGQIKYFSLINLYDLF